jgi:hypothetical protein
LAGAINKKTEIKKMPYQRIVCFKFKPEASHPAIQYHLDTFKALRQHIPQILSYQGGLATAGDYNQPPDYDTLHYLTFAGEADIEVYYHHPAHQRFIEENKNIWAGVFVLTAAIE